VAHYQQLQFIDEVRSAFPEWFENKKVLEIGSSDVNGSVRKFFKNCEYVGSDIAEGPGVDLVCQGQEIDKPSGHFDVVISCECFEHNKYWLETFTNMLRMLKPGGLCIITCATTGRGEHGTMRMMRLGASRWVGLWSDYYQNLSMKDFTEKVNLDNHLMRYAFFKNIYSKDLYLVGVKNGTVDVELDARLGRLKNAVGQIKTEGRITSRKELTTHLNYWRKWIFAALVGEKVYQNTRYSYKIWKRSVRKRISPPG